MHRAEYLGSLVQVDITLAITVMMNARNKLTLRFSYEGAFAGSRLSPKDASYSIA